MKAQTVLYLAELLVISIFAIAAVNGIWWVCAVMAYTVVLKQGNR